MFNRKLRSEALNRLEQEKKIFVLQVSTTRNKEQSLYKKKLEVIENLNDFIGKINLLKDKPKSIEENLYQVNFILKNSNFQQENMNYNLESLLSLPLFDIGGFTGIFTEMMSSNINREVAESAFKEIERLKSEIQELKKIDSNIDFNYEELSNQFSIFLEIVTYKLNLTGKSHWSELSVSEMEYIGTAINLASTIVKLLNKEVV